MKYAITIRNPGLEEYAAGNTIAEARKEAKSFMVPEYAGPIHICVYKAIGTTGELHPVCVEVVR